jgi:co-chaperonin GroES (HSP10)
VKLAPYNNMILAIVREEPKLSKGGILAPQIAQSAVPWRLVDVVAVGPGATNAQGITKPCQSQVGDCLMIPKQTGTVIPIDDVEHLAFAENIVIGKCTEVAVETRILAMDGQLMRMVPSSMAKPDAGYANEEATEIARRGGWLDDTIDPKTGRDAYQDDPQ